MVTSGTTASSTSSAAAVVVLTATQTSSVSATKFEVVNEGPAGFFSIDGGNNWIRLPASSAVQDTAARGVNGIQIKRDGATDMSGVYARAWR